VHGKDVEAGKELVDALLKRLSPLERELDLTRASPKPPIAISTARAPKADDRILVANATEDVPKARVQKGLEQWIRDVGCAFDSQ
ncbi:unnamed protein product, partial [Prorocentrum cordatum]